MGWLRLVGSIKLYVSFAKEPYKRDDILQKRPVILSILLTVAAPYDAGVIVCHLVAYLCHSHHHRRHMGWLQLVGSIKL